MQKPRPRVAPAARDEIRAWLDKILASTGWKPAELARRSGVSPSTLTRALSDDSKFVMTMQNVIKIEHASGILLQIRAGPAGFREPEAAPYLHAIDATAEQSADIDRWEVQTACLALSGCLPGDIIEIDRRRPAADGDIVMAQDYDHARDTARTVLRLYDPPYLVTHGTDSPAKPLLVDGDRIHIVGVMTKLVRIPHRQKLHE